jgi:hypothetical protein
LFGFGEGKFLHALTGVNSETMRNETVLPFLGW